MIDQFLTRFVPSDNTVSEGNLDPAVAIDEDGTVATAWRGSSDMLVRLHSGDGTALTDVAQINPSGTGSVGEADISAIGGGRFMATWHNSTELFGRVIDSDGRPAGDTISLAEGDPFVSATEAVEVVRLDEDQLLAAWIEIIPRGGGEADDYRIAGRKLANDGTPEGASFTIQSETAPPVAVSDLDSASLQNGGAVLVWDDNLRDVAGEDHFVAVRGEVLGQDGQTVRDKFLVNDTTEGDQDDAAVAALEDGGFAVAWQHLPQSGPTAVHGKVFGADGSASGAEVALLQAPDQVGGTTPAVAGTADGDYVVAARRTEANNVDDVDVVLRTVSADGQALGSSPTVLEGRGSISELDSAARPESGHAITWSQIVAPTEAETEIQVALFGEAPAPTIEGTEADELLMGTSAVDRIEADAGNDTVIGNAGADALDGQGGSDLLIGGSTQDVSASPGAAVYRLYQATLERAPDTTGFENWTGRLEAGRVTLLEAISGFVDSPEFQATYGTLDDEGFVTLLYDNVLDRDPDAQGLGNWTGRLEDGMAREEVVRGFSESAEFREQTNPGASAYVLGTRDLEGWADDMYRLYQATLDRAPDLQGLTNWSDRLATGTDYLDVATGFTNSREFQATYGNLDDAGFVQLLYLNVLDRQPDPRGLANWTDRLEDGMSREEVLRGFAESGEFISETDAPFRAYMEATGEDVLDGGPGDDLLSDGFLADRFVFDLADKGQDRVLQVNDWDEVVFNGFGYADGDAARDQMREVGSDVVFEDRDVTVTFMQSTLEDFDALTLTV